MKLKRYIGKDAHEAIRKVKTDLGNEAIILNTRKIRQKGIMKFFAKPLVEVLATVEESNRNRGNIDVVKPKSEVVEKKDQKISELENKVNKMESILEKVYEEIKSVKIKNVSEDLNTKEDGGKRVVDIFLNNLLKNEVDAEIAQTLMESVKETLGNTLNMNEVAACTFSKIQEILGKPETIKLRDDGKPTVVVFIGPTGVGKTTTLAKIAADFALNKKKLVGLITADTYRISAVEQLRTYAEIMGIPLSVVYSPSEVRDIIEAYKDKDVVLMDTAGRSSTNKTQFEELKDLVAATSADEVFLVLSSTTSLNNLRDVIKNYCFLEKYKLIITKLDESPVTGLILNVKNLTKKSLSYVTTGQSVPDDIEVADVDKLTKNLLGSINI